MRVFRRPSVGTTLGFTALMVALGGTALAATGNVVNIADGEVGTRLAKVDQHKRLSVTGTVLATEAYPVNFFRTNRLFVSAGSCKLLVTPPSGRALIVKAVNVDTTVLGTARPAYFEWRVGTDCSTATPADDHDAAQTGMTVVPYEPGLAVPNGRSLYGFASGAGTAFLASVVGYTVPATAVPSGGGVIGPATSAAEGR